MDFKTRPKVFSEPTKIQNENFEKTTENSASKSAAARTQDVLEKAPRPDFFSGRTLNPKDLRQEQNPGIAGEAENNFSELTHPKTTVLELFRAAKAEGKVPWTDRTVNCFMQTKMTPSQYPKAFMDFKGWAKKNFFLTATQKSELNSMHESELKKLQQAGLAAQQNKFLSFETRIADPTATAPKKITVDLFDEQEKKTAEPAQKAAVVKLVSVVASTVPDAVKIAHTPWTQEKKDQ